MRVTQDLTKHLKGKRGGKGHDQKAHGKRGQKATAGGGAFKTPEPYKAGASRAVDTWLQQVNRGRQPDRAVPGIEVVGELLKFPGMYLLENDIEDSGGRGLTLRNAVVRLRGWNQADGGGDHARERAYLIGSNGQVLAHMIGTNHNAPIAPADIGSLFGMTYVHNHPRSGSFSMTDVGSAAAKNLKHIYAVGDDRLYQMALPRPNHKRVAQHAKPRFSRWLAENKPKFQSGELSAAEADRRFPHEIWKGLAEDYPEDYGYKWTDLSQGTRGKLKKSQERDVEPEQAEITVDEDGLAHTSDGGLVTHDPPVSQLFAELDEDVAKHLKNAKGGKTHDQRTHGKRGKNKAGLSSSVKFLPPSDLADGVAAWMETKAKNWTDPHPGANFQTVRQDHTRQMAIADAYDRLPEYDRRAEGSYRAMARDTEDQYQFLTGKLGIRMITQADDPYPNVQAMVADVANNKTLRVMSTATTGGHPYFSNEVNDKFRFVHDAFGHAATGRGFDRHGEEAAWMSHVRMYSPEARAAMTSETRGQNASLIKNGEFPPQKVAVLPDEFHKGAYANFAMIAAESVGLGIEPERALEIAKRPLSETAGSVSGRAVIFETRKPSRAVLLENFTGNGQSEALSQGRFRVTDVDTSGSTWKVGIEQTHTFTAKESKRKTAAIGKQLGKAAQPLEVERIDEDRRQVFGWALVAKIGDLEVIDSQGDVVEIEDLEKAAYDFVLTSRDGGDMHVTQKTATLIESMVFTPEKVRKLGLEADSLPQGWWVGFQVTDDKTWALIKAGLRKGFSIGGAGYRVPVEVTKHLKGKKGGKGHDQKSHGRRGASGTPGGAPGTIIAPEGMEQFSPKVQHAILKTVQRRMEQDGLNLEPEQIRRNLNVLWNESYTSNRREFEASKPWYRDANEFGRGLAAIHGVPDRNAVGVLAALSPQTAWGLNKEMGHSLMALLGANPVVRGRRLSEHSPEEVGRLITGMGHPTHRVTMGDRKGQQSTLFSQSVDNLAKATRLYRGESPDSVLGNGPKVRSFFNNLLHPDKPTSWTDDTHMRRIHLQDPKISNQDRLFTRVFGASPTLKSEGYNRSWGTYPYYAEQARAEASKLGVLPHELQAVTWTRWREKHGMKGGDSMREFLSEKDLINSLRTSEAEAMNL